MLNPFFLNGSNGEQGLVQDLINEQLKIYGIEVYYLPRAIFSEGKVIREAIYSKFQNAFPIEAYVQNFEGFQDNTVLMSKFGVRVTDELNLIISKERFELYIGEIMKSIPNVKNFSRPNEGDLIYVPLTESLMEIKFVENRRPFFQLQKIYVYELRCELYELEDDEIKTGITDIDKQFKDESYSATLTLSGIGVTATATSTIVDGGIQTVDIINGGYGFSSTPSIVISSPTSGTQARVVGTTTSSTSLTSKLNINKVYIEDGGSGYTKKPTISLFGGGGTGASFNVGISTTGSVGFVSIANTGQGYTSIPNVIFSSPPGAGVTATGEAVLNSTGGISTVRMTNCGSGYLTAPTVTISAGSTISTGNFKFNETVTGSISNATGLVRDWDPDTRVLKVYGQGKDFIVGDLVKGSDSSAEYFIQKYNTFESDTEYDQNEIIQEESDNILQFDEINPFGEV